ncbi:MAG TPA: tetratricopeptide repeat-containing protein kinase family protein, partial [Kofleriaceae bacterium]|nr:tetratricopeptide repeat-containing protein kinase family protein [Kofleriaceae bacterium]
IEDLRTPPSPFDLNLTGTDGVIGTPSYMAPEQLVGDSVDARSDQFAFCVALWEALYGVRPFAGSSMEELAGAIVSGELREPKKARVPRWLRRAVVRGLGVQPDERHPSMTGLLHALEAEPRRRRRRLVAAAAAMVLGGAGLVGYSAAGPEPELCTGAERAFDGVWDAPRREAVKRSFLASGSTYATSAFAAVERGLDQRRGRWVAMQNEVCRATRVRGEQPEELFRLKTICLESRRKEMRALVDLFSTPDREVVATAVQAVYRLSDLNRCTDAEALSAPVAPPTDPRVAAEVDRIETRVAEARARRNAGKLASALEVARAASAAARPLGYRPLEAEALYLQANIERRMGDAKTAEKTFNAALHAAEAGRHDVIEAMAWTDLVFLIGYEGSQYARGAELARHASAVLERLGGDAEIQGSLEQALGAIEADQGNIDAAVAHFERAVRLLRSQLGDEHQNTVGAIDNLAMSYREQGKTDRAIELHRQVLAIRQRTLGDEHPAMAESLEHLGNTLHLQRDYVESERYHREALAVRERTLDPFHDDIAMSLINLANTLNGQRRWTEALELGKRAMRVGERAFGRDTPTFARILLNVGYLYNHLERYDEALEHHRSAEAILARALGPEAAEVATTWTAMGAALAGQRRWRDAFAMYQRALPRLEKQFGPDHRLVGGALANLGLCHIELGQPDRAVPLLERASAIPESSVPKAELATWRFGLARALWESGRDGERATRLARDARDALAEARLADDVAEVDAWLRRATRSQARRASARHRR